MLSGLLLVVACLPAQEPARPASFLRTLSNAAPRHEAKAICVVYSPDGKLLASGGWDKCIRLWDTTTGKAVRSWEAHEPAVWPLAFSADGLHLLSAGKDGKVFLWDLAGKMMREFRGHTGGVYKFVWLHAEGRLLTASFDKTLREWDVATGEELQRLTQEQEIHALAIAADRKTIATASDRGRITLYSRNFAQLFAWEAHGTGIDHLAYSPDGKVLVSTGWDSTVVLWNPEDGAKLRTLEGHKENVWPAIFTADGKRLLTADRLGMIRVWEPGSGKLLREIAGPSQGVPMLALRPDGKVFATASWDGTLQQWDLETGRLVGDPPGHGAKILDLRLSPDGKQLTTLGGDGRVLTWDTSSGQKPVLTGLLGQRRALFIDERHRGVLIDLDGDGASRELNPEIVGENFAFAENETRLMGLANRGIWKLVSLPDGETLQSSSLPPARDFTLAPSGAWFVTAGTTRLQWYRARDAQPLHGQSIAAGEALTHLAVSPDSRFVVGIDATHVRVWESASGVRRLDHPVNGPPGKAARFTPDGRWLIVADDQGGWQAIDLLAGKVAFQRQGPAGVASSLAISGDGTTLAIGLMSGEIHLWNLAAESLPSLPVEVKHPPERLRAWLKDLASEDGPRVRGALTGLLEAGPATVALIQAEVKPDPKPDATVVARVIVQLDADEFDDREKARKVLVPLGSRIEADLKRALQKPRSLDQRRQIEAVLEEIATARVDGPTQARYRAIEILERLRARESLEVLATGDPEAEATRQARAALVRLSSR